MVNETPSTDSKFLPEVIIGIVSPVGTNLVPTINTLKKEFERKKFNVHHIKISSVFSEIAKNINYKELKPSPTFDRVDTYIKFGNYLRDTYGPKTLAALAILEIGEKRTTLPTQEVRGVAYIVDQLKTEAELELLREIYGVRFIQVSVYSARDIRVDNLAKKIARDDKRRISNSYRDKSESLVVRDEDEHGVPNGQRVGKIFQLADVVINDDINDDGLRVGSQVQRFVELLFGHNGYSPNRLEYGMYLAHSAALRSLDLSRQVGAAVFRCTGEVAALGSNEVPKAGGGTYWSDDAQDAREYALMMDSNDIRKRELLDEVLGILDINENNFDPDKLRSLEKSQFMDALEYGRIVHAEMSAISDAARLGIELKGGTLYCTTFPCHMCAKHIVASGISKVVFLEPYPKSLTSDLHSDSVKVEGNTRGNYSNFNYVLFSSFYGITPRRYREFFYRAKRKDKTGSYQEFGKDGPSLMFPDSGPYYANRESDVVLKLNEALQDRQLMLKATKATKDTKLSKFRKTKPSRARVTFKTKK